MKCRHPGPRKARRRSLILLLFLVFMIASGVSAADETTAIKDPTTTPNTATDPAATSPTDSKTSTTATTAPTTTAGTSTTQTTTESTSSTSTSTSATSISTKEPTTTTTKTTDPKTTSFILSQTSTTTTGQTTNPTTSTTTVSTNLIPVVTVPPTADAPYMQKSNIPEGTVFIAVGAALGAIGLSVLAWRGLVAWSVNRSVRRAALMHSADNKRVLRSKRRRRRSGARSGGTGGAGAGGGVYAHGHARGHSPAPASSMSLDTLAPNAARSNYMANTRSPSSNSGLFFSPTAAAGAGPHGAAGKRGSGYLPAGYYSAASATPGGGGGGMRGHAGDRQSMPYMPSSLSNLRPQSQGYIHTPTLSPPSSPGLPPAGMRDAASNLSRHSLPPGSTSSVNLQSPSQPRAPSAYLEDLFDSHAPSDMSR